MNTKNQRENTVPGIVLLPGAIVRKEGEQGLAMYLCSLGYERTKGVKNGTDLKRFSHPKER